MNTDELVDKYLGKICSFYYLNCNKNIFNKATVNTINDYLGIIINKNREHILTDSFIYYLTHYKESFLLSSLDELAGDSYSVIYVLKGYFLHLISNYANFSTNDAFNYTILIDDELGSIVKTLAIDRLHPILVNDYSVGIYNCIDVLDIVCIILAEYVLGGRKSDVMSECDIFLRDYQWTIDTLYINEIYGRDIFMRQNHKKVRLVNFVNQKINSKQSREIL